MGGAARPGLPGRNKDNCSKIVNTEKLLEILQQSLLHNAHIGVTQVSSKKCQEIYQSARCHFKYFDLSSQLGGDMQKLRGQVSEDMILHGFTFELLFS